MRFAIAVFTVLLLTIVSVSAQDIITREHLLAADSLDAGGFGHMVAGSDMDGDGRREIIAVNTDWFDVLGFDLTPRVYKYEDNGAGEFEIVWWTELDMDFQNTWPALAVGDVDNDGREEIWWSIPNNFGSGLNPNPDRIVVFESVGGGSDNMGIDNGDGTWSPNAAWNVDMADNVENRAFKWVISDVDGDGTDEIVTAVRSGGQGVQVYSVSDVPDNGDGSEAWTIEFSLDDGVTYWDLAVIDNSIYGLDQSGGITHITSTSTNNYSVVAVQAAGTNGGGSWKSAETVDVDGDGTEEIIVSSWSSSTRNVYLLQQSGDTLTSTIISEAPESAWRLYGGAAGDIDNDGDLDYVFGTRESTPNGQYYRLEYQGGDIDDDSNWELTLIDEDVSAGQQYDISAVADLDNDGNDEVIYSGIPRGLGFGDAPQPIVVLERLGDPVSIEDDEGQIVNEFSLSQNYPNPFNPETIIEYNVPTTATVSLAIYNMLGQKVVELVNGTMTPGLHQVRWNGVDARGVTVANGVYIYTMRAGSFVQSKKMTLLK